MQSNGPQSEWREAKVQEETHWTLIESLPHLSMRVRSHGECLQSQQATSVGLTLTILAPLFQKWKQFWSKIKN